MHQPVKALAPQPKPKPILYVDTESLQTKRRQNNRTQSLPASPFGRANEESASAGTPLANEFAKFSFKDAEYYSSSNDSDYVAAAKKKAVKRNSNLTKPNKMVTSLSPNPDSASHRRVASLTRFSSLLAVCEAELKQY